MSEAGQTILGFNRSSFLTWAGVAGAAFVGYALYFDNKRRSAPDYKQKIREKRRQKMGKHVGGGGAGLGGFANGVPDPMNPTQMQAFFLQEVQLGEELMSTGNIEQGATHIANAIVLCGQSQQLLSIFQQTLPPEQFAAVVEKLPSTRERLADMFGAAADEIEANGQDGPPIIQYMGDGPPPVQIQELIDDEELE